MKCWTEVETPSPAKGVAFDLVRRWLSPNEADLSSPLDFSLCGKTLGYNRHRFIIGNVANATHVRFRPTADASPAVAG